MWQRTHRGESLLFLRWRWRWRGAQFQIHLLHLHLLLPQPLLTLLALPILRSSLQIMYMSVTGASCCYGCCLCACYYKGVIRPTDGPSRGHYRAESRHASSDHEPPRSPARACTAHSRSIYSSSLLGHASSRRNSFRSTGIYTATIVRWSHSLL